MYYYKFWETKHIHQTITCPPTIQYLICKTDLSFYINLCVDLLNVFTKQEFMLEMFVAVCLIQFLNSYRFFHFLQR